MPSKAYQVVRDFEKAVADFAGSQYAVAVDNCTNALFLSCKYLKIDNASLPRNTYPSVPCAVIHAGGKVSFRDDEWRTRGFYQLEPFPIYDAAHLFKKNMFQTVTRNDHHSFMCISFSATKPINIGKGGMILTNDKEAVKWFKKVRYCGRNEVPLMKDEFTELGWNMYMTPEQAARGLILMNDIEGLKPMPIPNYPDLSQYEIYQ